jgi:type I restriction enzyme S subunit
MSLRTWTPQKLDQLGFVGRGKSRHRPRDAAFLYGGAYPFFQTGDIKAARLYLRAYRQTYSEAGLAQSKLWKTGTLCITIAANIAESAILGVDGCFPDSVVGFVADVQKADVRFIKYCVDMLQRRMQSISRGTTQDNLSLDKLLSFDFLIPSLSVQREIADVLSAYDDLMENNAKRIGVIDEMIRLAYRKNIETSAVATRPLGELATEVRRNVRKGKLVHPQNYVGLEHIPRRTLALNEWVVCEALESNKLAFKKGEVLFGKIRPYFHKVCIAPFDGVCSADTIVIAPREDNSSLVAAVVSSDHFVAYSSTTANGSKMPRASWSVLAKYPVPIPARNGFSSFNRFVQDAVALQQSLVFANQRLSAARDLLFPKIMAEELDVSRLTAI